MTWEGIRQVGQRMSHRRNPPRRNPTPVGTSAPLWRTYFETLGLDETNIVFSDANLDQAEAGVLAGIFAAASQLPRMVLNFVAQHSLGLPRSY